MMDVLSGSIPRDSHPQIRGWYLCVQSTWEERHFDEESEPEVAQGELGPVGIKGYWRLIRTDGKSLETIMALEAVVR